MYTNDVLIPAFFKNNSLPTVLPVPDAPHEKIARLCLIGRLAVADIRWNSSSSIIYLKESLEMIYFYILLYRE